MVCGRSGGSSTDAQVALGVNADPVLSSVMEIDRRVGMKFDFNVDGQTAICITLFLRHLLCSVPGITVAHFAYIPATNLQKQCCFHGKPSWLRFGTSNVAFEGHAALLLLLCVMPSVLLVLLVLCWHCDAIAAAAAAVAVGSVMPLVLLLLQPLLSV